MATETFEPNVEYAWKDEQSWRWDKDGGSARDWTARGNWSTVKVPKGWSKSGPYYTVTVVFSDRAGCGAYPKFCAKCTSSGVQSDRTHVRELWHWKHSGQLVKEYCRDLAGAEVESLLLEVNARR
jgi:hypothetical protein